VAQVENGSCSASLNTWKGIFYGLRHSFLGDYKMTLAEIEGIKHQASWLNSLATAVVSGGIIVPSVAFFTGVISNVTNIGVIALISGICLWAAIAIHEQGAKLVSEIE
jgi:hypothetical protein